MTLRADQPPSRRTLASAAVVVAGCLALFVLIAEDVFDGGGFISRDEAVLGWFVDHRTQALVDAARWVSTLGGFVALCVLGSAIGLWLWSRRISLVLAVAPLASLLIAGLASILAKELFGRDRPPITLHATAVGLASFPSAHATDAAAFFVATSLTLALTAVRSPRAQLLLLLGGIALAGLVGISRLVLAVHWLSDVIAGWALGTAVATTVVMLAWYGTTLNTPDPAGQPADPT